MDTMTKTSIWAQAKEQTLQRAGIKALRKNRPLKVFSDKDLLWYLNHGWRILSHNPASYGRPQFWLLVPMPS
jgi:hypothetical protein